MHRRASFIRSVKKKTAVNKAHCPCAGSILGQRRRWWFNIETAQGQYVLCLLGSHLNSYHHTRPRARNLIVDLGLVEMAISTNPHFATFGLTVRKTGVCEICMKRRGASNMDIHYDVIGLLSAVWKVTLRSTCLGYLSWPGRRGSYTHSTYA